MKTRLLAVLLAFACAVPAWPYGQPEILKILFAGIRSRDPQVQQAVVLLRSKGLLEARAVTLASVAEVAESPEVREALMLLHLKGLLPDAQTSPEALGAYLKSMMQLAEEESAERAHARTVDREKKTLLYMGETTEPAPYYVYIPKDESYILGGMVPAGVQIELTYARADGFVEVLFPALKRGLMNKDFVRPTKPRVSQYRQDPEETRSLMDAPMKVWKASCLGAELTIAQFDLKKDGPLELHPYVTSRYNNSNPGTEKVAFVHDLAKREQATLAVNGTFFIMGGDAVGTPLAPLIVDGAAVWSHGEARVRNMRRSYIAVTESNRVVVGDTPALADEIVRANHANLFDKEEFKGEKIKHLMGGLGWLVRDGDPNAWREYAGKQFGYSYYSSYVKRPQTAIAVSPTGRRVWLVVQEGQPHSRKPLNLPELAAYMFENFKPRNALFLDGGGSSEMVLDGKLITRAENNGSYRKNSTALMVSTVE